MRVRRLLACLAVHSGFARPRRPERMLAMIVALLLGVVVGAVWLNFSLEEALTVGTPRWWYLVYVAALCVLGVGLAPWPKLAAIFLSLALVEVGIGIGSGVLYRFELAHSSFFPRDNIIYSRFTWHPLLQAVPKLTSGSQEGHRFVHNSLHQRGPERSATELRDKHVVALFGGSTTYDVTLAEEESWARQLQKLLGSSYSVINHGLPGLTTSEHVVQTAFYADSWGVEPACALYYIGWNDLRNSHVQGLDPAYADHHLPSQVDAQLARRLADPYLAVSPLLSLVARLAVLAVDTVRPVRWEPAPARSDPDLALEAIYARNIRTLSAINRARGVKTILIGQLMDRERLEAGEPWGWVPYLKVEAQWPLVQRLNAIALREATALGDIYVEVPADLFISDDFADHGHFEASGAAKFAQFLAPVVEKECR